MTDNEIIKAFESLYKKLLNVKYDLKITQKEFLALNRVDTLINRQRAKIDDLERDTIPKLRWSLERANKYGAEADRENLILRMEIANAKAEARKECSKEICEEIIKRFDRLLKVEPNRGTTTSAKDFLETHLPYVINSILKGITEAGK